MDNDEIMGAGGTFFLDVPDGTVEQNLSNGEVRTFPPSNGKSVSPLMVELHKARHTATLGATRDGMSGHPTCRNFGESR
ncbi:hypothetical protein [Burkholderia cepacia]|uniref:hypothetical protein n=1 Tax=Burkholderia cepacia TaxID=292 RepID=UPI0012D89BE7|nr:hypothetical protein [Burkholderia cepacia]